MTSEKLAHSAPTEASTASSTMLRITAVFVCAVAARRYWSPRYRHEWETPDEKPDYVLDRPDELPALLDAIEKELDD